LQSQKCHVDVVGAIAGGLSDHRCSGWHWLTTTESIFERNAEGWERFKADMKAHWIDGLPGLQKLRGRLRRIRSELRWNPSKLADRGEAVVSNTLGYS
jgi:hypothetical protein